jgi:hypothetical protein
MTCDNPCINLPADNLPYSVCWKAAESNFRFRCYRTPQGVADQEAVELLAAAGEAVNRVITSQLFNPKALCHPGSGASKADGSRNRRSIRGNARGGASSAAMKAVQLAALSVKRCRSASVSSARPSALSSTNWLTD